MRLQIQTGILSESPVAAVTLHNHSETARCHSRSDQRRTIHLCDEGRRDRPPFVAEVTPFYTRTTWAARSRAGCDDEPTPLGVDACGASRFPLFAQSIQHFKLTSDELTCTFTWVLSLLWTRGESHTQAHHNGRALQYWRHNGHHGRVIPPSQQQNTWTKGKAIKAAESWQWSTDGSVHLVDAKHVQVDKSTTTQEVNITACRQCDDGYRMVRTFTYTACSRVRIRRAGRWEWGT